MKNSEFIDRVMDRLGRRKNPDLRANVVTEAAIRKATYELSSTLPWWTEDTKSVGFLTVGTSGLILPDDFIRESEQGSVRLQDPDDPAAEYYPRKKSLEVIQRQTVTGTNALPQVYAIQRLNLSFGPNPDKAYQVFVPGYYHTQDLVDDADGVSGWYLHAPELMLCGIVSVVAESPLRDVALATRYKGLEEEQKVILWKSIEARINANLDVQIGEEEEIL